MLLNLLALITLLLPIKGAASKIQYWNEAQCAAEKSATLRDLVYWHVKGFLYSTASTDTKLFGDRWRSLQAMLVMDFDAVNRCQIGRLVSGAIFRSEPLPLEHLQERFDLVTASDKILFATINLIPSLSESTNNQALLREYNGPKIKGLGERLLEPLPQTIAFRLTCHRSECLNSNDGKCSEMVVRANPNEVFSEVMFESIYRLPCCHGMTRNEQRAVFFISEGDTLYRKLAFKSQQLVKDVLPKTDNFQLVLADKGQ